MIGELGTALIRLGASIGLDLAWELTEASTAAVRVVKDQWARGRSGHATFCELYGLACAHLTDRTVVAIWEKLAAGFWRDTMLDGASPQLAAEYIVRRLGLTHDEILASVHYGFNEYPLPDASLLRETAWRLRRMIEQTDDAPLILALKIWSDVLRDQYKVWYTESCPSSMPLGWW